MKKYKKHIAVGLSITIAILLCLQVGAVNIEKENTVKKHPLSRNLDDSSIKQVNIDQKTHNLKTKSIPMETTLQPVSYPLNTEVAGSSNDEYHPTLASTGSTYLAGYTLAPSLLQRDISFAISDDGGATYTSAGTFEIDGVEDYPALSHWGGNTFYGTFTSATDDAYQHLIEIPDVTDPGTWTVVYWDWSSYEWSNIHALDATSHNSQNEWEYGALSGVASTTYEDYEITNGPHMFFASPEEEGTGYISWWDMNNCNTSSITMDKSKDMIWAVYDIRNETTDSWNIMWWKRSFEDPLEGISNGSIIQENFNLINPSVAANNDNIAIVCQADEPGNQDVICLHSSDGGETWESSDVAATSDDELYPDVALSGGGFSCTFVKNGNLHYASSDDGGATWSEAAMINDEEGTVLSEYKTAAASAAGAIWSDIRNDNSDVYYSSYPGANINIKEVSGGLGVSAVIENTGTADATDIQWSIDVTGGLVLTGGHTEGTISTLAAGESVTVSSGPVIGFGGVDIAITADGASKTASGTLLLLLLIGVS